MAEGSNYRDDVFSREVRAGKRKYFFDVKTTRGNDLFMTITESKRSGFSDSGQASYEKHKIFLYKEDFDKFIEGLEVWANQNSDLLNRHFGGSDKKVEQIPLYKYKPN